MKPIYYLGQINFIAKETMINNIYEQFFMLDESTTWNVVFSVFWLRPPPFGVSLLINNLPNRKGYLMVSAKISSLETVS
jgi:hypothetical protein